eukprot:16443937-Heterocapsa_arctica.AAC.1
MGYNSSTPTCWTGRAALVCAISPLSSRRPPRRRWRSAPSRARCSTQALRTSMEIAATGPAQRTRADSVHTS